MDWLAKYHAVIVCDKKVIRIPFGDKVLIIQGDGCNGGSKLKLNIISCTKTQKYTNKVCQVFLVQVTTRKTEEKSKEKRIEDAPTVRDFLGAFLEDFLGLLPTRQVKFQIDLVPSALPVTRSSYHLASLEMQELSTQLQKLSCKRFIRPSSSPWGGRFCSSRINSDLFGCVSTTIRSGYHQLKVREKYIAMTACKTRYGHCEF
nr:hypothetical protein [Tanacetum cinerariifolium]